MIKASLHCNLVRYIFKHETHILLRIKNYCFSLELDLNCLRTNFSPVAQTIPYSFDSVLNVHNGPHLLVFLNISDLRRR